MKFLSKLKEPAFHFRVVRMFENGCVLFWWIMLAIAIWATIEILMYKEMI